MKGAIGFSHKSLTHPDTSGFCASNLKLRLPALMGSLERPSVKIELLRDIFTPDAW